MVSRGRADKVAAFVGVVILLVGGFLAFRHGLDLAAPTKTTTVVESASGSGVGKATTTSQAASETGSAAATQEATGEPTGKTTTTTETGARSTLERALDDGGAGLIKLAAVMLATFVAAAFTQRLLLGDFSLKLGPLELAQVQERNEQTLIKLTARVAEAADAQNKQAESIRLIDDRVRNSLDRTLVIAEAIAELKERVQVLERKQGNG